METQLVGQIEGKRRITGEFAPDALGTVYSIFEVFPPSLQFDCAGDNTRQPIIAPRCVKKARRPLPKRTVV